MKSDKYYFMKKTKEELIGIIRDLQEDEIKLTKKAVEDWKRKYELLLMDWNILHRKFRELKKQEKEK